MTKKEHSYFKSRLNIYVALDHINTEWTTEELLVVVDHWNYGYSLERISSIVNRPYDETGLLIFDLAERTKLIYPRSRGIKTSSNVNLPINYRSTRYQYTKKSRYIVLDNLDFDPIWDEREVLIVEQLWRNNHSIRDISKKVKRRLLDCILLIIDRASKGYISQRNVNLEGLADYVFEKCSTTSKRKEKVS